MSAPSYPRWFEADSVADAKALSHHLACLLQTHPRVRPRVLSLLLGTRYPPRRALLGWPPRTARHWRDLLDSLARDDRRFLRALDLALLVGVVLVLVLAFYLFATG